MNTAQAKFDAVRRARALEIDALEYAHKADIAARRAVWAATFADLETVNTFKREAAAADRQALLASLDAQDAMAELG